MSDIVLSKEYESVNEVMADVHGGNENHVSNGNQVKKKRAHRNKLSITAAILRLTMTGCRKTRIMYGANLSYDQLSFYLSYLEDARLIARSLRQPDLVTIYSVTPKGMTFLEKYYSLKSILGNVSVTASPPGSE